jgi:Leucine-rich repeat (LRR) protein
MSSRRLSVPLDPPELHHRPSAAARSKKSHPEFNDGDDSGAPAAAEISKPSFKDQMRQSPVAGTGGGGGIVQRRLEPTSNTQDTPSVDATLVSADATLISDSRLSYEERIQLRQQNLELQVELDRQRVANLQQQQQAALAPIPPPSSLLSKSVWIGLASVASVLFVALATAAGVCGTGYCSRGDGGDDGGGVSSSPPSPTMVATDSPVTVTSVRADSILSFINGITLFGRTLSYPSSSNAEERTLKWLIEDDLNTAVDDGPSLRQRYALGTLWFRQTPTTFGTADHATTWTTNIDECQWHGVDCDAMGRVTVLDLSYVPNVRGQIPNDLGLLTDLTRLLLSGNQLTGTIPSSLGVLTALTELQLLDNRLNGSIPSSLGALTGLMNLELSSNQLSGTIPPSFGGLTALARLNLSVNQLNGAIPWSSLVSLTALTTLGMQRNQLSGAIPSSFGALTALTELWLPANRLGGTIPSSLGALTALRQLWLYDSQLSGTIPSSLGALTALTVLELSINQLSGTIPSSFGALTALNDLALNMNMLTGTIPSSLGALTALNILHLFNNAFTGTIPSSLDALTALTDFQLHDNRLIGTVP